ncbi:MAG: hypothetical protein P8Y97_08565 [Candidatus Lokiarchaeota archaeon]
MIIKLVVKKNSKPNCVNLEVWILFDKDFINSIMEILRFFKDNIKIYKKWRFYTFYKITSENPAILLSLFSAIQDLIPETYINQS